MGELDPGGFRGLAWAAVVLYAAGVADPDCKHRMRWGRDLRAAVAETFSRLQA